LVRERAETSFTKRVNDNKTGTNGCKQTAGLLQTERQNNSIPSRNLQAFFDRVDFVIDNQSSSAIIAKSHTEGISADNDSSFYEIIDRRTTSTAASLGYPRSRAENSCEKSI
jgi:hypothetical protein